MRKCFVSLTLNSGRWSSVFWFCFRLSDSTTGVSTTSSKNCPVVDHRLTCAVLDSLGEVIHAALMEAKPLLHNIRSHEPFGTFSRNTSRVRAARMIICVGTSLALSTERILGDLGHSRQNTDSEELPPSCVLSEWLVLGASHRNCGSRRSRQCTR